MEFLKLKENTHEQLHEDDFLYVKSNRPIVDAIRNLKDVYEMKGSLKFKELVQDGYMDVKMDPSNEFTYVPYDSYQLWSEGKEEGMIIRYGQHNESKVLEGYGRSMWISVKSGLSKIWEG